MRKASTFSRFQTKESEKGEHIFKISDQRRVRKASTCFQDFRLKRVRKVSTFSRFQTKESKKGEHMFPRFQTKESEKD